MNETMSELLNGIDGMTSEWMEQGQNVIRLMEWQNDKMTKERKKAMAWLCLVGVSFVLWSFYHLKMMFKWPKRG